MRPNKPTVGVSHLLIQTGTGGKTELCRQLGPIT